VNEIARFMALSGVAANPGATDAQLTAFETQTDLTLPSEVRQLYQHANGLVIDRGLRLRILSLEEVARYVESFQQFGIPTVWGYFPFTDRNDSNPHCVCCDGPARGYVVRVNHDDIAPIEYRSLGGFLTAVRDVLQQPETDEDEGPSLWNLPQDFHPDTSDRISEDVATAKRLLDFAGSLEEGSIERADAERWAITLFSEAEAEEVARLLDEGDEYRRREAVVKLSRMASPAAAAALQRHRREEDEFSRKVVQALEQAGLTVAEVSGGCPRLEPGCVWLNVPMFFTDRRRPAILSEIVQRSRELIALNTQNHQ
jgi:hypothetical protein